MSRRRIRSRNWTFSFRVPEGFFIVDLDTEPGKDRAAATAAVEAAIARTPDLEPGRELLVEGVAGFIADARSASAVGAATVVDSADGAPVHAYVMVLTADRESKRAGADDAADGAAEVAALRDALCLPRQGDTTARVVTDVDLPAGPAIRVRVMAESEVAPESGRALVMDLVQHWVPVPGKDAVLVLSSSTPLVAFGDVFADIFDAIARTLRFGGHDRA